jgi:serine/threonine-protein kinase 24/25/MST4
MSAERYTKRGLIGRGSFGEVFRGVDEMSRGIVAIKEVEDFDPNSSVQEVSILRKVSHVSIIKYLGSFFSSDGGKLCIVMEFANSGTLESHITKHNRTRKEYNVWRFLRQISDALDYLHTLKPQPVLHRDLKPANILVHRVSNECGQSDRLLFKISDFGIAKLLNKNAQGIYYGGTIAGTPIYMAPEVTIL